MIQALRKIPKLLDNEFTLDTLSEQCQEVLEGRSDDVLENLLVLNGSSAGARPKALIDVNDAKSHIKHGVYDLQKGYSSWIVKFSNTQDGLDAGAIEYVYALMAKEAGINMPEMHLFPANKGAGYFAVQRFDKDAETRLHMHSACGLLHSDFLFPDLDYEDLITLTWVLTRDIREVERMFRVAVFNVLSHNRDDHAKNFSFLMDQTGNWRLSPAYDITFSSGPGGEQSTMVFGEGLNPTVEHLVKLGEAAGIIKSRIFGIINQTRSSLDTWPATASQFGVQARNIKLIQQKLKSIA